MKELFAAAVLLSLFVASGCGSGGGWTDDDSGLTWMNPPAASKMFWQQAIDYCNNLTLNGHNDWHLPTISELRSLIRGCPATETGGACGVTDSCLSYSTCCTDGCNGCSSGGGPAGGCYWPDGMQGMCGGYWSSSEREDDNDLAWFVYFNYGDVANDNKVFLYNVRCVR